MDRRQFFGDSVAGAIIRLVLISIVVGIVFSALGITPFNLVERLEQIVRRITDLGFDAFRWAFNYFLLGADHRLPGVARRPYPARPARTAGLISLRSICLISMHCLESNHESARRFAVNFWRSA